VTEDGFLDTAGSASPDPAVSSVPAVAASVPGQPPDAGRAAVDVVPPEARVELDRIRRRWAELPLARAEAGMPLLRRLLADLAPRSAPSEETVPDLGAAVVADQLAVLVWDAYAVGRGDGIPAQLAAARRALD
jgi:hypothetical protein